MSDSAESESETPHDDCAVCEKCDGLIDFRKVTTFYKTADERYWHEDCHDPTKKLDRADELRGELISLMVPEDCFDGLSDEFHYHLDTIQAQLDDEIRRERLRQDQELTDD
jgi:hypothetical protein